MVAIRLDLKFGLERDEKMLNNSVYFYLSKTSIY